MFVVQSGIPVTVLKKGRIIGVNNVLLQWIIARRNVNINIMFMRLNQCLKFNLHTTSHCLFICNDKSIKMVQFFLY
jgi:hypothetical protein